MLSQIRSKRVLALLAALLLAVTAGFAAVRLSARAQEAAEDVTVYEGGTTAAKTWWRNGFGDASRTRTANVAPAGAMGQAVEIKVGGGADPFGNQHYGGVLLDNPVDVSAKDAISFYFRFDGITLENLKHFNNYETQFAFAGVGKDHSHDGAVPDQRFAFQFDTPNGVKWENFVGGWKKITVKIPAEREGKLPAAYTPGRPEFALYDLPDFTKIDFFGPTFRANGNDASAEDWAPLKEYNPTFSYLIADVVATDWTGSGDSFLTVEDAADVAVDSVSVLGAAVQDADVEYFNRAGTVTGAFSEEKPGYQLSGRSFEFSIGDHQNVTVAGLKLKNPVDMTPILDGSDVAVSFWLYISDAALFQSKFTNSETQFILSKSGILNDSYLGDSDNRFSMDLDWTKFQTGWNQVTFRVRHGGALTHGRDYYAGSNDAVLAYAEADYVGLNVFGPADPGELNGSAVLRLYNVQAVPVPADMEGNLTVVPLPKEDYNVSFLADGNVIQTIKVKPGESLDKSKFPAVPEKKGYTGVWDRTESLADIRSDVTVNAVYTAQEFTVTVVGGREENSGAGKHLCGSNVLIRAQAGKTVKEWKVTGATGKDNGDGTYSFTMPGNDVTVEIVYQSASDGKDDDKNDQNEKGGCGGSLGLGASLTGGALLLIAAAGLYVLVKRRA